MNENLTTDMKGIFKTLFHAEAGSRDLDKLVHEKFMGRTFVDDFTLDDTGMIPYYTSRFEDAMKLLPVHSRWELRYHHEKNGYSASIWIPENSDSERSVGHSVSMATPDLSLTYACLVSYEIWGDYIWSTIDEGRFK